MCARGSRFTGISCGKRAAWTGTVQWDRQFQSVSDNLDGTLLYSEGTLYAHAGPTGNTYDEGEGGIRAVDAASGDTLWSFTDLQSFGTLAAVDGTLVAKGDSRATTYGLDPETGEVRWSTDAYPTSRFGCRDGTCYAYGGSARRAITVTVGYSDTDLIVSVIDTAPPIDSRAQQSRPLDTTCPSGLGSHLIRACVDEVVVDHSPEGGNRLKLVKRIA